MMNIIECHIHVLLQLYAKMAGTVLFLNEFPDNTLTHLCMNDFNLRAYCQLEKSEIAKINTFHSGPNTPKFEIK